jgi:hypothetical protein|tara:strand:+ start:1102 stop:1317 length:216 start_codon:yes stop_codon:yes gene_type:complete
MEENCRVCKNLKYVVAIDMNNAPRASTVCRCYRCNIPRENKETGKTADTIVFRGNKAQVYEKFFELTTDKN